jgi:DNA-binding transcriptional LysR family regulator
MEMQQARYFVALCETLNFTRAAEKCNVTQPSLTRAIKLLEDELGGPLFNRERNQTHLTELGRLMESHLREVIEQAQTARARAQGFFALRNARLKLGVARGVSFHVLDDTLRRFVANHRDTEIELHDDRATDLREALRRGDFELVLLPQRSLDLDDLPTTRWARIGCSRSCRSGTSCPPLRMRYRSSPWPSSLWFAAMGAHCGRRRSDRSETPG